MSPRKIYSGRKAYGAHKAYRRKHRIKINPVRFTLAIASLVIIIVMIVLIVIVVKDYVKKEQTPSDPPGQTQSADTDNKADVAVQDDADTAAVTDAAINDATANDTDGADDADGADAKDDEALTADGADGTAEANLPYYYEPERADRYTAYAEEHPKLSDEEVYWRVDADVDLPPYEDITEIKDTGALPLLVDKHFKLPDGFVPANLVSAGGGYQLTRETKDAYDAMHKAAAADGRSFSIVSAYRSIDYQRGLYAKYLKRDGGNASKTDTYSARPGHSSHHTGRTMDLVGEFGSMNGFGQTKASTWIIKHAWEYGFVLDYTDENVEITGYKSEPWQITYVGKPAAKIIHNEGIGSLEEYYAKYIKHEPGEGKS